MKKGFTLIELLVVISIISLLSTVVLASLKTARDKAKDVAIKSSLQQLAKLAELNFNDYGDYANLLPAQVMCNILTQNPHITCGFCGG